jgi:hypothetical protein
MSDTPEVEILHETERYTVWRAKEPDGETQYHVGIENVSLHFFEEEWQEFLSVMRRVLEMQPDIAHTDREDSRANKTPAKNSARKHRTD